MSIVLLTLQHIRLQCSNLGKRNGRSKQALQEWQRS